MQTFNLKWDLNSGLRKGNNPIPKKEEDRSSRSFPQANLYIAAALLDKQRHVMTRNNCTIQCEAALKGNHLTHSMI